MRILLSVGLLLCLGGCGSTPSEASAQSSPEADTSTRGAKKPALDTPRIDWSKVQCVKAPCGASEASPAPPKKPDRDWSKIRCVRAPCGPQGAKSPLEGARFFYELYPEFFQVESILQPWITQELWGLLQKERACTDTQGMCTIGADPWSAAQDGERQDPVTYQLIEPGDVTAKVRVCFQFVLDPQALGQRCAVLSFRSVMQSYWRLSDGESVGHWRLDDLVSPDGSSLKQDLHAAHSRD